MKSSTEGMDFFLDAKLFLRKAAAVISHVPWLHRSRISLCSPFLTHAWASCVISQAGRGTIRRQKGGRSATSYRQQNYVIIAIVESFDSVEISLISHRIFCGKRIQFTHFSRVYCYCVKRNCKCKTFLYTTIYGIINIFSVTGLYKRLKETSDISTQLLSFC